MAKRSLVNSNHRRLVENLLEPAIYSEPNKISVIQTDPDFYECWVF
jgi:hypothetical protein